jgi:Leucine-rich repeat (LRR) protein
MFLDFDTLQEIYITHSNLPAIGDSTFWPGKHLQLLDLSFNNITILRESDFNGLINLMTLDLSDNSLSGK